MGRDLCYQQAAVPVELWRVSICVSKAEKITIPPLPNIFMPEFLYGFHFSSLSEFCPEPQRVVQQAAMQQALVCEVLTGHNSAHHSICAHS